MGLAWGVALALIVDEAALLITLEDVYWQTAGWPSVASALVLIGVGGTLLALTGGSRHRREETTTDRAETP